MGLELGIGNKILSFESMDITEKSNEYLPLLKDYKAIPSRMEHATRALKPHEGYMD